MKGYDIATTNPDVFRVGDTILIEDERHRVIAKEGNIITVAEYPSMWTWVKRKIESLFK